MLATPNSESPTQFRGGTGHGQRRRLRSGPNRGCNLRHFLQSAGRFRPAPRRKWSGYNLELVHFGRRQEAPPFPDGVPSPQERVHQCVGAITQLNGQILQRLLKLMVNPFRNATPRLKRRIWPKPKPPVPRRQSRRSRPRSRRQMRLAPRNCRRSKPETRVAIHPTP